ncbi:phosphatidylinositol glycan class L [Lineolata rhizophorae]|uniref:N-acetylglucosaminylphosphatidylinositol deacetylase n=1 Tax=Lineolata rhizophorae TaxID=578093 RepID=A0A6A6NLN9_9PEZI|nr:phosphatidylinositol glycan class L [Lineolata rhizophorae]
MNTYVALASLPILIVVFWMYTAHIFSRTPFNLHNKRILLLIAHPDDEAMFFAPTLLSLTRAELGNHVKILCLSTGDADGLGSVRKHELVKSGLALGIRSENDILVLDDPNFPDSMDVTWHPRLISNLLTTTFAPNMAKIPSDKRPEASIDAIVTFDAGGVSGHPNHKSLHAGAHAFIRALMHRHAGWDCPVKLYSLTTTNIVRKYASVLDAPTTLVTTMLAKKDAGSASGGMPSPLVFLSDVSGWRRAQGAMTTGHKSQMRWFRWGWIGLSRYMVMNDLRREKVG